MENLQVCFVNTNQEPVKTRHVCFYTIDNGQEISLIEVKEVFFPHPDAPEVAIVSVFQNFHRGSRKRTDFNCAPLIILEAAQKVAHTAAK